ncbi:MAG TPA: hypothetical protein P5307_00405 [Pirellulaceae bacterium]|nr:hypothetical protein [Pirellulaceae bacterium]
MPVGKHEFHAASEGAIHEQSRPRAEATEYCASTMVLARRRSKDDLFYAGGGCISAWTVSRDNVGRLVTSGSVTSQNTGTPMPGVTIYAGNLEQSLALFIVAQSDTEGRFAAVVPTEVLIAESSPSNSQWRPKKIDVRYLYVGEPLLRYELP